MGPRNKTLGKGAVLALVLHDWTVNGWGWMATVHDSLSNGLAGMIENFGFISWLSILAFIAAVWFSRSETGVSFFGQPDDLMRDR